MKLTDERILELEGEYSHGYFDFTPEALIAFARALLKEAGVEELERDKKRLEYLANSGAQVLCGSPGFFLYWHTSGRRSQIMGSIEEAIDEAMNAK